MKIKRHIWTGIGASICLLIIILDTKTAIIGGLEGIELSLNVVIPSLLPFLILTHIIGKTFTGVEIPLFRPLNRLCGIPRGAESLFLLGFVGGYPVGAKSIENAFREGCIDAQDAKRMLGFCSNAGPAFIFGMAGRLFPTQAPLWALWAIHIISSLLVGCILPKKKTHPCLINNKTTADLPAAVESSIKTMGLVCAWVIVFRILITFLRRWFLWMLSPEGEIALIGLLELTNGCVHLNLTPSYGLRFVLCAMFLSFGGLCVAMQTVSVTKTIGTGMYFPGKILQSIFSIIMAAILQVLLFERNQRISISAPLLVALLVVLGIELLLLYRRKKVVAIHNKL